MKCPTRQALDKTFELRLTAYIEACSAAFYLVSTKLAARKQVDMERAKNDVQEHRHTCLCAMEVC